MTGDRSFFRVPPDSTGKRFRTHNAVRIEVQAVPAGYLWQIEEPYLTSKGWQVVVFSAVQKTPTTYILEVGYQDDAVLANGTLEYGDTLVDQQTSATVGTVVNTVEFFTNTTLVVGKNNPDHGLAIDGSGAANVRFAEGQPIMGGFGGLKITNQRALGVYESSLDSYDDLFNIATENGGTSEYQSTASSHVLRVTGTSGSSVTRTTRRYHYYLPGCANLVNMTTACNDTGRTGNVRRWGAFDDNDGVFFELYDTTVNVVIRSSVTGTIEERRVPQNLWNFDRVDGTGNSGHILDVTKINIWWMDYQWLGAGRARFGIVLPDGSRLVVHQFENAGQFPLPYMRTGTLPLRTENYNYTTTGASSELRELCMAIFTEGTFEDYTYWRKSDVEAYATSVSTANTQLFSIRLVPTIDGKFNSVQVYPEGLNIYTTQPVAVTIWQGTAIAGGSWNMPTDGIVQGNTDGTISTTNATKFKTFFVDPGSHNIDLCKYFEVNDEGILALPSGQSEVWSFTATPLTANAATVTSNLSYKELW